MKGEHDMTLYEIDKAITDLADPETGEITDFEALDNLQMARDQKIENIACYYKNLVSDAEAIKAEKDALTERQKAAENKAARLKEYLSYALRGEKFSTPKCAVTFRKTTSVNVDNPSAAIEWAEMNGHKECVRYKAPEISKSELGKVLKTGQEVPGAALVEGLSVGVK